MTLTPFPRPFYKTYAIAGIVSGLSVAFILTVLQPFGTASFQHQYKLPILAGYGVVIASAILVYYYLSINWVNKSRNDTWTILHEIIDYFIAAVVAMIMTYVYYINVFDFPFRWAGMFGFMKVASAVNTLPMIGLSAYIYLQYRDVIRSNMTIGSTDGHTITADLDLTLKGINKTEELKTSSADILYIKAEDNYVIISLLDETKQVKRHMIRSTMKDLLLQLPTDQFIQCHRSYIVNSVRIIEHNGNKNSSSLTINGSEKQVPVGRSKYDDLKAIYG